MRLAVLTLALAACASPPAELPMPTLPQRAGVDPLVAARAEGVVFRARGDEFVLNIYREDRITVNWRGRDLVFPTVEPAPAAGNQVYETTDGRTALRIEIQHAWCAFEGKVLPALVEVTLDGETLRGCGQDF